MKVSTRQLRRIIEEEKRRLRETDDFRDPKTGENLWLVLNGVIDQMLTQGIDTLELANELRSLADDVEDSAPSTSPWVT